MAFGLSISRLFAKNELKSNNEGLSAKCMQFISQIFRLEIDLHKANNEINRLKTQVAEYDVLLLHFKSRSIKHNLAELHTSMNPEYNDDRMSITNDWIEDIWMCSSQDPKLQRAENLWKDGSLDLSQEAASHAIRTNQFLPIGDMIRYRIFIAAILHSRKKYSDSNYQLDTISDMLMDYSSFNGPQTHELIGMANFVRGRNLLVLEQFEDAYLCLSRAFVAPGYGAIARKYRRELIIKFTDREAAEAYDFSIGKGDHLASLVIAGGEYEKLISESYESTGTYGS